jgi:formate/nitrite transporter FocA (FNT family)
VTLLETLAGEPARQIDVENRTPAPAGDPLEPHSISTTVTRVADVAVEKAAHPLAYLVRSLAGGAMVAFGVVLALSVSAGIQSPGLASLVMGLAFGFSFVLILVSSMSLITADMAAGLIAVLQKRMTIGSYLRLLAIGWTGNIVGVLVFVAVAALAGGPYLMKPFLDHAAAVGVAKSGATTLSAILLAVLCTWFLQTAMFMYFKARSEVARMSFAFYGPFAFVVGGTQHVIANAGFIGLPLLIGAFHPEAALGVAQQLSWGLGGHGLMRNFITTTIGNFIGGTLFVAAPFYLIGHLQDRAAGEPRRAIHNA